MNAAFFQRLPQSKAWWIALGVVLFVVFLVRSIPAHWGAFALTQGTGIALSGVTGTLWDGRASLASVNTGQQEISLGQLSWRLQPLSLLTLRPCVLVSTKLDRQTFDGQACVMGSTLRLRDAEANLPISLLQAQIPIPVQGQLSLHVSEMRLRGDILDALAAKLTWNNAQAFNGSKWMSIGSYGADLSDDGNNGVAAKIVNLDGPIELDAQLNLRAPSGGSINGTLVAENQFIAESHAAGILAMVGRQEGEESGKPRYVLDMEF